MGFSKLEGLQSTQTFKDRWNFARCSGNIPCFHSWDSQRRWEKFTCDSCVRELQKRHTMAWSYCYCEVIHGPEAFSIVFNKFSWTPHSQTHRIILVETDFRRLKADRNVITHLLRTPNYFNFHILQSSNLVNFILKQCRRISTRSDCMFAGEAVPNSWSAATESKTAEAWCIPPVG